MRGKGGRGGGGEREGGKGGEREGWKGGKGKAWGVARGYAFANVSRYKWIFFESIGVRGHCDSPEHGGCCRTTCSNPKVYSFAKSLLSSGGTDVGRHRSGSFVVLFFDKQVGATDFNERPWKGALLELFCWPLTPSSRMCGGSLTLACGTILGQQYVGQGSLGRLQKMCVCFN